MNTKIFFLFSFLTFSSLYLSADTHTWDGGGGDGNWLTAANWVGDVAPIDGDDLVFAGTTRLSTNNNFSTNTNFSSITISAGAGNFVLAGNPINIFGGASAITANHTSATITISLNIAFTTGAPEITTVSGGTLVFSGNIQNNFWLVTADNDGALEFSGVISGGGGFTQSGVGTVSLSGTNTYTGTTTISSGTFSITSAGQISSSSDITNNSNLLVDISSDWTYSGVISGTGTLEKRGSGKLTLSSANTFTGNVFFTEQNVNDGGIIAISNADGLGAGPKTIELLGYEDVGNVVELSGGITVPSDITLETRGRSIVVTSTFLRNKSGTNTWAGPINIVEAGGLYAIESEAGTLTISGTFSNNYSAERWLRIGGAGDGVYSGVIQDGTSELDVIKNDGGTWVLTGANTYTGNTTINSGTLQVGDNGTTGTIPATGITNDANLTFFRSNNIEYSAVISGTGTLTKKGAGTLTLSAANTFTGDILFEEQSARDDGAILVTNSSGLGSGLKTIQMYGNGAISNIIQLSGGITVSDVAIETYGRNSGGVSDVFLKNISGNNTWTGNITIVDGGGSYVIELDADQLTLSGNLTNNWATSNRTFNFRGVGDALVSGIIKDGTNTALLAKSGTGDLILTGANTYTGATTVSGGILRIGNNGTTGTIASSNVANAGTVEFFRSNDVTYSGVVSGTGALIKNGAGTLTLSGANTYTGNTIINTGALQFGVADALGTTDITINTATLSTGATTGYSATVGTLTITGDNVIDLGTGDHTLTFANSSGETWSSFVTIEGWSDVSKYDGTAAGVTHPKIFVGSDAMGLSAGQLLKIAFFNPDNSNLYEAAILAPGEVVPTATVLPVELLSYTANKRNESVFLNWVTGSEIESDYFVLYHSTNGVDFNELTRVDAAGTSTELLKYNFTHNNPAADNYYKLVQVDFDGTTYDKGIRYVRFEDLATVVQVFPNPSPSFFTIKSLTDAIEFYELLDSRGRLVLKSDIDLFQFEMGAQLASGTYFLTVWINDKPQTIKLIKQ